MQLTRIRKTTPFFLIAVIITICYYPVIQGVGYLTDDWKLLERTASPQFWLPVERHHWSLLLNTLFHFSGKEWISPATFHLLAGVGHLLNTWLVYYLAAHHFHLSNRSAWAAAALFALSPSGVEALIWCCAIGYVYCAFWILSGIAVYLRYLEKGTPAARLLTVIQLAALLTWDWGILLPPALFVIALLHPSTKPIVHRVYVLIPAILCCAAALALKKGFDLEMGYTWNTFTKSVGTFALSPLPALLPQMAKTFYLSPAGIAAAITLLSFLGYTALNTPLSRIPILLFFLWQTPAALFGHPQSRYCYLPNFALALAAVIGFQAIVKTAMRQRAAFLLFTMLYLFWTVERIGYWIDASYLRDMIKQQLEEVADASAKKTILISLPRTYAPKEIIWKPHVWESDFNQVMLEDRSLLEEQDIDIPAYEVRINAGTRPPQVHLEKIIRKE